MLHLYSSVMLRFLKIDSTEQSNLEHAFKVVTKE